MKPKSAIEKGKRGENQVCELIEMSGLGKSTRTPGSGSGKKKGDIFNNLDFLIEVKNQATLKIPEWIRQAKEQARIGNYDPDKWALVYKETDAPQMRPEGFNVILDFVEWLELLKRNEAPKVKEPDRELKYRLESMSEICRRLEKEPLNKYEYGRLKKLSREINKLL